MLLVLLISYYVESSSSPNTCCHCSPKLAALQLKSRSELKIITTAKLTFTCLKSTIEPLEKGTKYVQH